MSTATAIEQTSNAIHPDSYYEDVAKKTIANLIETEGHREPDDFRFVLHRAYPFSIPVQKAGKAYKIWLREIHKAEKGLGYEPRIHKTKERVETLKSTCAAAPIISSKQDLIKYNPEPTDTKSAATFLRKHCRASITMFLDRDELRVVLKSTDKKENAYQWHYKTELTTDQPDEWNRAYLEAAQAAYAVWLGVEGAKY